MAGMHSLSQRVRALEVGHLGWVGHTPTISGRGKQKESMAWGAEEERRGPGTPRARDNRIKISPGRLIPAPKTGTHPGVVFGVPGVASEDLRDIMAPCSAAPLARCLSRVVWGCGGLSCLAAAASPRRSTPALGWRRRPSLLLPPARAFAGRGARGIWTRLLCTKLARVVRGRAAGARLGAPAPHGPHQSVPGRSLVLRV